MEVMDESSNCGLLDLYDDILTDENNKRQEDYQGLEEKYKEALEKISSLESDLTLSRQNEEELRKKTESLEKNISELLVTAKAELQRKDKELSNLRDYKRRGPSLFKKLHHRPNFRPRSDSINSQSDADESGSFNPLPDTLQKQTFRKLVDEDKENLSEHESGREKDSSRKRKLSPDRESDAETKKYRYNRESRRDYLPKSFEGRYDRKRDDEKDKRSERGSSIVPQSSTKDTAKKLLEKSKRDLRRKSGETSKLTHDDDRLRRLERYKDYRREKDNEVRDRSYRKQSKDYKERSLTPDERKKGFDSPSVSRLKRHEEQSRRNRNEREISEKYSNSSPRESRKRSKSPLTPRSCKHETTDRKTSDTKELRDNKVKKSIKVDNLAINDQHDVDFDKECSDKEHDVKIQTKKANKNDEDKTITSEKKHNFDRQEKESSIQVTSPMENCLNTSNSSQESSLDNKSDSSDDSKDSHSKYAPDSPKAQKVNSHSDIIEIVETTGNERKKITKDKEKCSPNQQKETPKTKKKTGSRSRSSDRRSSVSEKERVYKDTKYSRSPNLRKSRRSRSPSYNQRDRKRNERKSASPHRRKTSRSKSPLPIERRGKLDRKYSRSPSSRKAKRSRSPEINEKDRTHERKKHSKSPPSKRGYRSKSPSYNDRDIHYRDKRSSRSPKSRKSYRSKSPVRRDKDKTHDLRQSSRSPEKTPKAKGSHTEKDLKIDSKKSKTPSSHHKDRSRSKEVILEKDRKTPRSMEDKDDRKTSSFDEWDATSYKFSKDRSPSSQKNKDTRHTKDISKNVDKKHKRSKDMDPNKDEKTSPKLNKDNSSKDKDKSKHKGKTEKNDAFSDIQEKSKSSSIQDNNTGQDIHDEWDATNYRLTSQAIHSSGHIESGENKGSSSHSSKVKRSHSDETVLPVVKSFVVVKSKSDSFKDPAKSLKKKSKDVSESDQKAKTVKSPNLEKAKLSHLQKDREALLKELEMLENLEEDNSELETKSDHSLERSMELKNIDTEETSKRKSKIQKEESKSDYVSDKLEEKSQSSSAKTKKNKGKETESGEIDLESKSKESKLKQGEEKKDSYLSDNQEKKSDIFSSKSKLDKEKKHKKKDKDKKKKKKSKDDNKEIDSSENIGRHRKMSETDKLDAASGFVKRESISEENQNLTVEQTSPNLNNKGKHTNVTDKHYNKDTIECNIEKDVEHTNEGKLEHGVIKKNANKEVIEMQIEQTVDVLDSITNKDSENSTLIQENTKNTTQRANENHSITENNFVDSLQHEIEQNKLNDKNGEICETSFDNTISTVTPIDKCSHNVDLDNEDGELEDSIMISEEDKYDEIDQDISLNITKQSSGVKIENKNVDDEIIERDTIHKNHDKVKESVTTKEEKIDKTKHKFISQEEKDDVEEGEITSESEEDNDDNISKTFPSNSSHGEKRSENISAVKKDKVESLKKSTDNNDRKDKDNLYMAKEKEPANRAASSILKEKDKLRKEHKPNKERDIKDQKEKGRDSRKDKTSHTDLHDRKRSPHRDDNTRKDRKCHEDRDRDRDERYKKERSDHYKDKDRDKYERHDKSQSDKVTERKDKGHENNRDRRDDSKVSDRKVEKEFSSTTHTKDIKAKSDKSIEKEHEVDSHVKDKSDKPSINLSENISLQEQIKLKRKRTKSDEKELTKLSSKECSNQVERKRKYSKTETGDGNAFDSKKKHKKKYEHSKSVDEVDGDKSIGCSTNIDKQNEKQDEPSKDNTVDEKVETNVIQLTSESEMDICNVDELNSSNKLDFIECKTKIKSDIDKENVEKKDIESNCQETKREKRKSENVRKRNKSEASKQAENKTFVSKDNENDICSFQSSITKNLMEEDTTYCEDALCSSALYVDSKGELEAIRLSKKTQELISNNANVKTNRSNDSISLDMDNSEKSDRECYIENQDFSISNLDRGEDHITSTTENCEQMTIESQKSVGSVKSSSEDEVDTSGDIDILGLDDSDEFCLKQSEKLKHVSEMEQSLSCARTRTWFRQPKVFESNRTIEHGVVDLINIGQDTSSADENIMSSTDDTEVCQMISAFKSKPIEPIINNLPDFDTPVTNSRKADTLKSKEGTLERPHHLEKDTCRSEKRSITLVSSESSLMSKNDEKDFNFESSQPLEDDNVPVGLKRGYKIPKIKKKTEYNKYVSSRTEEEAKRLSEHASKSHHSKYSDDISKHSSSRGESDKNRIRHKSYGEQQEKANRSKSQPSANEQEDLHKGRDRKSSIDIDFYNDSSKIKHSRDDHKRERRKSEKRSH